MGDLLAGALIVTAAVLTARIGSAFRATQRGQTFRLTFPCSVTPEQVIAALRSVPGLLPRFPDRLVITRSLSIETVATAAGISHYLRVPAGASDFLVGQFRAAIPGLRVVPAGEDVDRRTTLARELHAGGTGSLRVETTAESNAALLATLQPLGAGEAIVMQWALSPIEPLPSWLLRLQSIRDEGPERGQRDAEPVMRAICRVGVRGPASGPLLGRVFGAIHRADTTERRLCRLLLPSPWVAARLHRRAAPVLTRSTLAADELAAVLAVPVAGPQLPGLAFAASRPLSPAPAVSQRGRVLGDAIATGQPVAISEADSRMGLLVTSPTGSGKSTVLEHLCAADFTAGHGVIVIETKGDLCHALAGLVPRERIRNVVVFDPADPRPAGFNLLSAGDAAADLITDHVVGQFRQLYAGYLGPRSEMLLRAALLTLSQASGSWTVCEVMPTLTDPALRRRLMASVTDDQLAATWAWFEAQSGAARGEMVGPLANKLAAFTLRRHVRAVVGQAESALDFDRAMAERRIVLISLRKGLIGEDAASLLGSCILAGLWAAIQRRSALPPRSRRFVSVVLDEAQDFLRLPIAAGDAAAQSRALGCGWTASFQNLRQIEPSLRATLIANLRSKLVMQTTADDAATFAREFTPHLEAADLQGLGPFEAYAAVATGAAVAPPVLVSTRPPLEPVGLGDVVRARSRERHGRRPADVDAEIRDRITGLAPEAPVGARRRG